MGPMFEGNIDPLDVLRRYVFEELERRDALQSTADLARGLRVVAGLVSLAAGALAWVAAYSPAGEG